MKGAKCAKMRERLSPQFIELDRTRLDLVEAGKAYIK